MKLNKYAFTLVEIMIVVMIIGLLAIMAFPNFARARTTATKNMCINNLRLVNAAKEQFALTHSKDGDYVPSAEELLPYLKDQQMPTCPASGENYTFNAINTDPSCDVPDHEL